MEGLTDGVLDLEGDFDAVIDDVLDFVGLTEDVIDGDFEGVTVSVPDFDEVELNELPLEGVFV